MNPFKLNELNLYEKLNHELRLNELSLSNSACVALIICSFIGSDQTKRMPLKVLKVK